MLCYSARLFAGRSFCIYLFLGYCWYYIRQLKWGGMDIAMLRAIAFIGNYFLRSASHSGKHCFFLGGAFILRVLLWLKMQKLFYGIGSTSTLFYCICLRNRIILTHSSYCGNYRNNITSKKHINDTDNIKRTQRKYGYHIGFSRQRRRCCNMPKW